MQLAGPELFWGSGLGLHTCNMWEHTRGSTRDQKGEKR